MEVRVTCSSGGESDDRLFVHHPPDGGFRCLRLSSSLLPAGALCFTDSPKDIRCTVMCGTQEQPMSDRSLIHHQSPLLRLQSCLYSCEQTSAAVGPDVRRDVADLTLMLLLCYQQACSSSAPLAHTASTVSELMCSQPTNTRPQPCAATAELCLHSVSSASDYTHRKTWAQVKS